MSRFEVFCFCFVVLGNKPRALCMFDKCSSTELYHQAISGDLETSLDHVAIIELHPSPCSLSFYFIIGSCTRHHHTCM